MPTRVRMTRQRPWRHEHPDAVIVARPSKWGNREHHAETRARTARNAAETAGQGSLFREEA